MATRRFLSAASGAQKVPLPINNLTNIPSASFGLARGPKPGHSSKRSTKDFAQRQTPRKSSDLSTRLRILFSRPSSSRTPAPVDEATLLAIIRPVFETERSRLDPFLHDIAVALSPERQKSLTPDPKIRVLVTEILAYCWIRSNELKPEGVRTSSQLSDIARRYARRLVRLVADGSDPNPILSELETNLRVYKPINFMLPPTMFAAWAVLRHEASEPTSLIQFIPTKKENVFKALHDLLGNQDQEFEQYTNAVEELIKASSGNGEVLPDTPEQLNHMLSAMRVGQQTAAAVALWGKYKAKIKSERRSTQQVTDEEQADSPVSVPKNTDARVRSLASFLQFFSRSAVMRRLPAEERELSVYKDEVLSYLPRPYPPAIHHALLLHRARIDDDVRDPSEVESLDTQAMEFRDRAQVSADLEAVWRNAGEEGARDLKAYMLYMEGVAKVGDAHKLGTVWEELVRDAACKEAFIRDEKTSKSFPPTRALNHMISCAFLSSSKQGVEMAMELFRQAILPSSAIPCDIVTINIVLRHYARRGVVSDMIALFPIAEQHNLRPDVKTYTTLLQGLLRAREVQMAAKTLETMYKQGVPPNEQTISLLISDLARYGDRKGLKAAEDLMKEMRRMQMRVGEIPWTSLISGYFRGGWDLDAWDAVYRMGENGVKLNRVAYNMIIRELGERVFPSSTLHSAFSRNPSSWSSNNSEAKSLLLEMFERMVKEISPNSDTYIIALTPLVRAQRWAEADQVVRVMKEQGFVAEKSALRVILSRIKQRKQLWD